MASMRTKQHMGNYHRHHFATVLWLQSLHAVKHFCSLFDYAVAMSLQLTLSI